MTRTPQHEVHGIDVTMFSLAERTIRAYVCSAHGCEFATKDLTEVARHVVSRQYIPR